MMARQRPWLLFRDAALCVLAITSQTVPIAARGGEPDSNTRAAREQFFEQNVRPLLAENCYSCHGDKKQKGGLRLDSLEAILKGGESGPAVVPGKPDGKPAGRGDQLRGPRDAPNRQARPGEDRRPHPLGLPGCSLARPRSRGRTPTRSTGAANPARVEAQPTADRAFWSLQPVRTTGRSRAGRLRPPGPGPAGRATRSTGSSSRHCSSTV